MTGKAAPSTDIELYEFGRMIKGIRGIEVCLLKARCPTNLTKYVLESEAEELLLAGDEVLQSNA